MNVKECRQQQLQDAEKIKNKKSILADLLTQKWSVSIKSIYL